MVSREIRDPEGNFVYVLTVKRVHFIYIVVVVVVFFYTHYSVVSSEYIENALYFSISLADDYCHPEDFTVVHTFSFRTKDS